MADLIQVRRDTSTNWLSINPVLADGEFGYDKTNKSFKIGDGASTWSVLPTVNVGASGLNGLDGASGAIKETVTTRSIQPFIPTIAQQPAGGGNTWLLNDPIKTNGVIDKITIVASTAGTVKVKIFRGVAGTGNVLSFIGEISVVVVVGANNFTAPTNFVAFSVNKNDLIAFYSATAGATNYDNGPNTSIQSDLYFIGGDQTTSWTLSGNSGGYGWVASIGVTGTRDIVLPSRKLASSRGRFPAELGLVLVAGQSLNAINGDTTQTPLSTIQEHDNIGLPANNGTYKSLRSLTVANCGYNSNNESPIFGALNFMKDLILQENGISYLDQSFQLVGEINAVTNTTIAQNSIGQTPFINGINALQVVKDTADANAKTSALIAVLWEQGQADVSTSRSTYLAAMLKLADDYDAQARSIVGATNWRPPIIICQACEPITSIISVALAQIDAAIEHERIYCAGPDYWLTFADTIHPNATYSRLLGAMEGLALKRVVVDGIEWEPLRPISYTINANTVTFTMSKGGLVLDTTLMPAQTNYGFSAVDASNSAITVSSVSLVSSNQIRFTLGTAPASGHKYRYGFNTMTGRSDTNSYGGGNVRDNQGARINYKGTPLHNWLTIFEQVV